MMLKDHTTADLRAATLAELARMAHDAEETADDVTGIGIMQELDARGGSAKSIFRDLYMAQWRERMGSNAEVRGCATAEQSNGENEK